MNFLTKLDLQGRLLDVIKRFPIPLFFAVLTTIVLLLTIDSGDEDAIKWAITGFVGFLATFNLCLWKESYQSNTQTYNIFVAIIVVSLGFLYYSIPIDSNEDHTCFWYFNSGLSIILHVLVSVILHLKNYNEKAFINYNITIFIAWMQAALYGIILYLALCLAILALDNLFDINFSGMIYVKLFILISGIFHTFFFLSEFPNRFDDESLPERKSIFRIIVSYIFIPIVIVYGLILYAYLIKLFISQNLVDWVSAMITIYYCLGISTYLFSCYYDNDNGTAISRWFKKWFFLLSGPFLVLLFYVLYKNISNQGIREELYFNTLIAIFILIVSIYSPIRKDADKRIFPISILFVTFLAVFSGPFSLCNLPVTNTQNRLISDLEDIGRVKNRKLVLDNKTPYFDSTYLILNKLTFLENRKKLGFIETYDPSNVFQKDSNNLQAYRILELLNIQNVSSPKIEDFGFSVYNQKGNAINLEGYQKLLPIVNKFDEINSKDYLKIENGTLKLFIENIEIGSFDITTQLDILSKNPQLEQTIEKKVGSYGLKIYVYLANCVQTNDKLEVENLDAIALLKSLENE